MTFDFALSRPRVAAKTPPMGAVGVCQSVDWWEFHSVRTQYVKKLVGQSGLLKALHWMNCYLSPAFSPNPLKPLDPLQKQS
ncbi:MAG: hypothetical protein EBW07_00345 [Rhodobacteraceae bacterium]|nr:hypothetical protein [Paracoccaceae bacterium]